MTEFIRDFGTNNVYQAEVNNRHGGQFIIYEGGSDYHAFTAEEALVLLDFLQTHRRFLQEAMEQGEEEEEEEEEEQ